MTRLPLLAILGVVLGAACRPPESARPSPRGRSTSPPPPARGAQPGVLDQVTAVRPAGGLVHVGTEAGVVVLDPGAGRYRLLAGEEDVSHAAVAALAVGEDGTVWSAHRAAPGSGGDGMRRGGVRAFGAGGSSRWWWSEDGLPSDDVLAVAVRGDRVVAAVAEAIAFLDLGDPEATWVTAFDSPSRKLEVVDPGAGADARRSVVEFRPRGERVTSVALDATSAWIGTTHGLYRRWSDGRLERHAVPCRVDGRVVRWIGELAADSTRVAAVLVREAPAGGSRWLPGGLLLLGPDSAATCLEPDVDVPASPSLSVALDGGVTWLATYQGVTRIEAHAVELWDAAAGAPDVPVTCVAPDGAGGCWFGTWGGGIVHVRDRSYVQFTFDAGPAGLPTRRTGALLE